MILKIYENVCFSQGFNLHYGIKMFKSKVPAIFGKNNKFFVHSAYVCSVYSTKLSRNFCKTWHALNFNFTLIMKFNLENRIFYFEVARMRKCAQLIWDLCLQNLEIRLYSRGRTYHEAERGNCNFYIFWNLQWIFSGSAFNVQLVENSISISENVIIWFKLYRRK